MKNTLSAHKKKAWDAFSLYIRTRDCLRTTGSLESGLCITCSRRYPRLGKGCLQAGHFIAGRGNSLLFDERGCHIQCYGCNVGRNGAYVEYFIFMEQNYGRDVIDELRQRRHLAVKFTVQQLDDIRNTYTEKTGELLLNPTQEIWKLPAILDHSLPF